MVDFYLCFFQHILNEKFQHISLGEVIIFTFSEGILIDSICLLSQDFPAAIDLYRWCQYLDRRGVHIFEIDVGKGRRSPQTVFLHFSMLL